jgi:DNA-binding transcriptional ArsR family regulator
MARGRMLPTKYFKHPDVMALSSGDVRLILVGLVLNADDEGRELAHAKLLGRELDYPPEQIEQALVELEANDLIVLYQVGKHRYYSITRWHEWQTQSKPTPSKYPPPPVQALQDLPGFPENPLGNPGRPWETSPEGEEKGIKDEEEEKGSEGEEDAAPPNIVAFPTALTSTGTSALSPANAQVDEATRQVASILKLPVDAALTRIVQEYLHEPAVSLLGEADSAREYIDDARRNRNGQHMSPAFFRRWLKREKEDCLQNHAHQRLATGTTGRGTSAVATSTPVKGACSPPSVTGKEDPYRAFVEQRMQELAGLAPACETKEGNNDETTP